MSAPAAGIGYSRLLGDLPAQLRDEMLDAYNLISSNYRERRWEPSELDGGKLCEIVYTILRGYVDGQYPDRSSKPSNMVDACRALEQADASFPRSVRVQIPRILIALYEIRNNRGVGHVGGEVDPNEMDATCVLYMSKWIVAELVRVFHNVDTATAAEAVEAIVERVVPVVWEVGGQLRVLNPSTRMRERTLLLLYSAGSPVSARDLFRWVEHSNFTVYRDDILLQLHKDKLVEFQEEQSRVHLSPTGIRLVEQVILEKSGVGF